MPLLEKSNRRNSSYDWCVNIELNKCHFLSIEGGPIALLRAFGNHA